MQPLHNQHVVEFWDLMCRYAAHNNMRFSQLVFYTHAMQERDPTWRPDHLRPSETLEKAA